MTHITNTPDLLSDYLPDPRRSAIGDIQERYLYFKGNLTATHTSLAANDTQTQTLDEPLRIKTAQVGTVSGGTVTVQVIADGRDIFTDAVRPVSGGAVREATELYVIPAGTVVQTVIEATSGAPTGNASVVLETEPFVLVPKTPTLVLKGKDRLFPSRRRFAASYNAVGTQAVRSTTERFTGAIGRTPTPGRTSGGGNSSDTLPDIPGGGIDPTKPPPIIKPPKPPKGGGGGGLIIPPKL